MYLLHLKIPINIINKFMERKSRATDKVLTEFGIYTPISDLIGYFQNQLGKFIFCYPTHQTVFFYYFHNFT